MLLRLALIMLLLSGGMLAACEAQNGANDNIKIGVADISRLMRDSVPGKAGLKYLEEQQVSLQKDLDEIQDELEKNPGDEKAMQKLQQIYASSQQRIQAEGQNVAALLFDSLQKILDKYRADHGFDVILSQDTVASFAKKIDVTNAVMAELDKQVIEFKPLPQPGAVKEAVTPATDEKASQEQKAEEPVATGAAQDKAAGDKAAGDKAAADKAASDKGEGGKSDKSANPAKK